MIAYLPFQRNLFFSPYRVACHIAAVPAFKNSSFEIISTIVYVYSASRRLKLDKICRRDLISLPNENKNSWICYFFVKISSGNSRGFPNGNKTKHDLTRTIFKYVKYIKSREIPNRYKGEYLVRNRYLFKYKYVLNIVILYRIFCGETVKNKILI